MKHHAQTIVQLLRQLCSSGYPKGDLELVTSAYRLAAELFTGLYRPSGKTFISHAVGTASILCELHARGALIAAGLLHAAYEHGDFGTWTKGTSPERRAKLRATSGGEVENYVARYTDLRWTKNTIPKIYETFRAFGQIERDVLLARLANELEDLSDLGVLYCHSASHKSRYYKRIAPSMIAMADAMGFPALASGLKEAIASMSVAETFAELRSRSKEVSLIVPRSYTRCMRNRVGRWASKACVRFRFAG